MVPEEVLQAVEGSVRAYRVVAAYLGMCLEHDRDIDVAARRTLASPGVTTRQRDVAHLMLQASDRSTGARERVALLHQAAGIACGYESPLN
jgi:hypothetical protein